MNPEIISYAKQFHLGILAKGQFKAPDGLNNHDFLLELFRAEAKQSDRPAQERPILPWLSETKLCAMVTRLRLLR